MAASSTAASSSINCSYDVFLNHRGPDVKKTFASHLYRRLVPHGFRVFLDQQEMQEGDSLTSQIEGAIATASVHVAIFSPRYAESKWCLDELVLMLKSGSTIIPVFHGVKPFELRWAQSNDGVYTRALLIHKRKRRCDQQTLANWRKALFDVSCISGFELEAYNGDEGELVDKVVQRLQKIIRKTPLHVATYPTGLDEKVEDFEKTVLMQAQQQHGRKGCKVVGIVGLGGVGKTTLAKEFFNRKRSEYPGSCFLFDVREAGGRSSLNSLQNKLVEDVTSLDPKIDSVDDGIQKLSQYLSSSQALVILDDVDHLDQMNVLYLPLKDILHSGSLIIVTSRNKDVLTGSGMSKPSIYKLTGLDREHSKELFCSHAFHQPFPFVGFEKTVRKFLDVCDGLPLSLKVLGAQLRGENDLEHWKAQSRKITRVLPADIKSRLLVSYDNLCEEEKDIFLDIACFFIGEDKDMAIRIWDGSGWEGSLGFRNLENRFLVEVDSENCISMHDHLRDLGRELAEKEPRHRIWRPTDMFSHSVFHRSSVRGMSMVQRRSSQFFQKCVEISNPYIDIRGLQLLRADGDCLGSISNVLRQSDLIWLCWENYPYVSLPSSWIPIQNLRVLELREPHGMHSFEIKEEEPISCQLETLWENEIEAPVQLRELIIGQPLLRFPKSIGQLKHLQKLAVHYIHTLPEELFHLHSLKHFRMCTGVKFLPESFGNLINLEYLDLSGSSVLQMLPRSFGNLIQLKHLSLEDCSQLNISPNIFGNISKLESLNLSSTKMQLLPLQVTHQRSLKKLYLCAPDLQQIPDAIGNLTNLEMMVLGSGVLKMLPPSLGNLTSLKILTLSLMKLRCLPDTIGQLKQLTVLTIEHGAIEYLPIGVMELNNLEVLSIQYCPLLAMPFASTGLAGRCRLLDSSMDKCNCMLRLKDLKLWGTELKVLSFPEGVCPILQHLNIRDCSKLVEVGPLPSTLISLNLHNCNALKKIRGLSGLSKLRQLNIQGCHLVNEQRL